MSDPAITAEARIVESLDKFQRNWTRMLDPDTSSTDQAASIQHAILFFTYAVLLSEIESFDRDRADWLAGWVDDQLEDGGAGEVVYAWRQGTKPDVLVGQEWTTATSMVDEFHRAFGVARSEPATASLKLLRASLIGEEAQEAQEALTDGSTLEDVAKELADLAYVTYGTANSLGIDLDESIRRVHASNMSKRNTDGYVTYRPDGKVLKPDHYRAPDMDGVANSQLLQSSPTLGVADRCGDCGESWSDHEGTQSGLCVAEPPTSPRLGLPDPSHHSACACCTAGSAETGFKRGSCVGSPTAAWGCGHSYPSHFGEYVAPSPEEKQATDDRPREEYRNGIDWCPTCGIEVDTNRYTLVTPTVERCGTCNSVLRRRPAGGTGEPQ